MFQKILKWISVSPHCERAKPGKWQGGTAAGKVLSRPWGDTEKLCSHSHRLWVEPGVPPLHTSQKFPLHLGLSSASLPFHILKAQRISPQVSHPGPRPLWVPSLKYLGSYFVIHLLTTTVKPQEQTLSLVKVGCPCGIRKLGIL